MPTSGMGHLLKRWLQHSTAVDAWCLRALSWPRRACRPAGGAMADLQLSMIFSSNDRSRPVLDGLVRPDGIDLTVTVAHPSEIFWRQIHFAEFDVSEMSMSSLLMVAARGDSPWVALPVFTARRFFHTWTLVRADAGI